VFRHFSGTREYGINHCFHSVFNTESRTSEILGEKNWSVIKTQPDFRQLHKTEKAYEFCGWEIRTFCWSNDLKLQINVTNCASWDHEHNTSMIKHILMSVIIKTCATPIAYCRTGYYNFWRLLTNGGIRSVVKCLSFLFLFYLTCAESKLTRPYCFVHILHGQPWRSDMGCTKPTLNYRHYTPQYKITARTPVSPATMTPWTPIPH